MKRLMIILITALVLLLATSAVILAQSGGNIELPWHVFGDGGINVSSGGNVTLSGTLGQTAAGRSAGGVVSLTGGFWQADFAVDIHTVTFAASGNGSLTGTTSFSDILTGTAWASAVIVPTPVANTGYKFDNWTPSFPGTVTTSATYTANFIKDDTQWFTVTFAAGGNGSLTGTTSFSDILTGTAWASAVTVPTPVANTGYKFDNWTPSFPGTVTTSATYTANFIKDDTQWFTVTFAAGGNGSLTGTTSFSDILTGTAWASAVTIPTPVANTGYKFDNWTPNFPGTVTESATYTANFAINTYTLTYTAGAHGSISGTSPQTVAYGTSGSAVTAVPDAGYLFVHWSDLSTANPRIDAGVTVNINVTASFAPISAPIVTTDCVSSIATTTATGEGNVTDDGGSIIIERGIVWNTGGSPTTAGNTATAPGTTGAYTASITGLTAGTVYHARAYAINAIGTCYGNELTFTPLGPAPNAVDTATGTGTATFSTSNGTLTILTAMNTPPCGSLPPPGLVFPHGFFSHSITGITPGATVILTISLPETTPVGTQYWKCMKGSWVNVTSLLGHNNGDNVLTLTLTDGGPFDADGVANGTIVDPGGPAVSAVPVPGVSQWGIIALVVLLGGAIVWVIRRKQIRRGAR